MRPEDGNRRVALRLPDKLLEKLERYADRLRSKNPEAPINRTEVVRQLLVRALDELEAKARKKKG